MTSTIRLALCALSLATACYAPTAAAQAPATRAAAPSWGSALAPRQAVATRDATQPAAPPVTFTTRPAAQHAVYVEANNLGPIGSLGVNYACRPIQGIALSVGVGGSYLTLLGDESTLYGAQVMVHGLLGGAGASSFEVAGGAAMVVADGRASLLAQPHRANGEWGATPAAFVGYRHQPLDGGLLFRLGLGWSYGNGVGVSVSLGASL